MSATSDYIYRGLSQSDGHAAFQADLHASTLDGTFAGAWGSTRNANVDPGAHDDVEYYLGQRFVLSSEWSTTVTANDYTYVNGNVSGSYDWQEVSAGVAYLDAWTFSVATIPNAVLYSHEHRLARYPAYIAETTAQWNLGKGFSLVGGAGYYGLARPTRANTPNGYAYGNVGLSYELRPWRLDLGYYLVQSQRAQALFPYGVGNRFAVTLSLHF